MGADGDLEQKPEANPLVRVQLAVTRGYATVRIILHIVISQLQATASVLWFNHTSAPFKV